ncbi:MAG: hypothetical protein LBE20_00615 [Deltaproteobacteria bacterium]|jgi:hypothetical protein|nr:hypothetical protein [Deltaproteobacteria bacterium]
MKRRKNRIQLLALTLLIGLSIGGYKVYAEDAEVTLTTSEYQKNCLFDIGNYAIRSCGGINWEEICKPYIDELCKNCEPKDKTCYLLQVAWNSKADNVAGDIPCLMLNNNQKETLSGSYFASDLTKKINEGDFHAQQKAVLDQLTGRDQTLYLDAKCNVISEDESKELCDPTTIDTENPNLLINIYDPVVLAWDKDNIKPTVIQKDNKWIIWRGSEHSPLLVFDPQKNGNITSDTQLFSQNSFGKKWKDGFVALASLDKNKDGKISGAELTDISLWFDKNQNGISEVGEVVDSRKTGLFELSYIEDGANVNTGDIIVSRGFSRYKNKSKVVIGEARDWFSKFYFSKAEAELALLESNKVAQLATGQEYKGIWAWSIDKESLVKEMANVNGFLSLNEEDGKIVGNSIIELSLAKNDKKLKSALVSNQIKDATTNFGNKSSQIKFNVVKNGLVTENVCEILADGRTMNGVSRAEIINPKTKQKQTLHYTWKAKKLEM